MTATLKGRTCLIVPLRTLSEQEKKILQEKDRSERQLKNGRSNPNITIRSLVNTLTYYNGKNQGNNNMKHLGDITKINGANVPPVPMVIGGSCQASPSAAGRREGLKG